jgi:uncharacterized protein YjbI with pentapeptide repeats
LAHGGAAHYNLDGSLGRTPLIVRRAETATPIGQRYSSDGRFFVLFDTRRTFIRTVTSSQELLQGYASGERNFAHADLHGDDLWGSELQGADLQGADLGEADLRRADLARTSLRGANLSHALLTGASLRGADLRDANLNGAILYGVDLTHARLEGADLDGAARYDPELSRRRRMEVGEESAPIR